ncbi:MAG: sigma-70 family RNA polymerase sigma factor [Clostridia bacterium]|nr:sigma-70 family RNA polymerase sigma factor [Clostridia bacterium]
MNLELFRQYRETGDETIRNRIAEEYLYIAKILAKKFVGRGVEYDDLFQVASEALLKGIDSFDPDLGVQFATFITPTITGKIKNYFRDYSRLVKVPRKLSELSAEIRKENEKALSETGKKPSVGELATRLGVNEEEIVRAMEISSHVSLDQETRGEDDEGTPLYNVIADRRDAFEEFDQKESLRAAMADLTEEEKFLVSCRFGHEYSQAETAKRMNVSQMYVSRMERKLLDKLREKLKD